MEREEQIRVMEEAEQRANAALAERMRSPIYQAVLARRDEEARGPGCCITELRRTVG